MESMPHHKKVQYTLCFPAVKFHYAQQLVKDSQGFYWVGYFLFLETWLIRRARVNQNRMCVDLQKQKKRVEIC